MMESSLSPEVTTVFNFEYTPVDNYKFYHPDWVVMFDTEDRLMMKRDVDSDEQVPYIFQDSTTADLWRAFMAIPADYLADEYAYLDEIEMDWRVGILVQITNVGVVDIPR